MVRHTLLVDLHSVWLMGVQADPSPGKACVNPLALEIEPFLLQAGDWVPSAVICERFGLADARALRGFDGEPGLVSNYAISGDRGYKHIEHATTGEWLRFKKRIVHHGVAELRRIQRLSKRRQAVVKKRSIIPTERDSDQTLFTLS